MSGPDPSTSPLTPQWPPHNQDAATPPAGGPEGLWHEQGFFQDTIDDNASTRTSGDTADDGLRARQAFEERYPAEGFEQM